MAVRFWPSRFFAVATASWKRELRSRTMLVCYTLAALVIMGSYVGYDYVGGGRYGRQLVSDLMMFASTSFGGIIAIFACATCVRYEIDSRQAQVTLSKPISRLSYLTGELSGCLVATYVILIGMTLASAFVFSMTDGQIPPGLPVAALAACIKVTMAGSIALCLSLFLSSHVSGLAALFIYVVAHLKNPLEHIATQVESFRMEWVLKNLSMVLPNFEKYNMQTYLHFYDIHVPWISANLLHALKNEPVGQTAAPGLFAALKSEILTNEVSMLGMVVYGTAYVAICLIVGSIIIRRKDV